jgi:hypothetical protein
MFPSAKTRFAAAARRGFDLAVEFATLGEYRMDVDPELSHGRPARQGVRSESRDEWRKPVAATASTVRPRPNRLRPATAAARRLQPVQQPQRIPAHSGLRALAFDARGTRRPVRGGRKRAGAAGPRPQPCLVAEAGGSGAMDG